MSNRGEVTTNNTTLVTTYNGTNGCHVGYINIQATPGVYENTWYKVTSDTSEQTSI
jgi:hypothetical protein